MLRGNGEKDKQRRAGGKGFYNLIDNSGFLPSTLPPRAAGTAQAQPREDPRAPRTYHRAGKSITISHDHLLSAAEIYESTRFLFQWRDREQPRDISAQISLASTQHGVSLFQSTTFASPCSHSTPAATNSCCHLPSPTPAYSDGHS